MKTRVMVVDDQVMVRQLLIRHLPLEGAYEIVGEAGTGLEAIRLLRSVSPHVVVLDLALPELSGAGLVRHLREKSRDTRTLVWCGTTRRESIVDALRARPHGFVLKRDPWSGFLDALRMVSAGCSYFTPFADRLLDETSRDGASDRLSPRQLAVVQMIAEGRSNKEMAAQLAIAVKTVDHHRSQVMRRLGLHDVAGITRYAIRRGLIDLEAASDH